jgi:NADP-dependent 3-hydroxy acid dehydrogenase YdfG
VAAGAAIAALLAAEGATVSVLGRDPARLDARVSRSAAEPARRGRIDVTDEASVRSAVARGSDASTSW